MVMTMMMPMMMIIIHNVPLRELHHHACIRKSRSNLYRSFRRQQPEHTLAYARLGSICVARPAAGDVGADAVVNSWWPRPAFRILYAELTIVQLSAINLSQSWAMWRTMMGQPVTTTFV